MTVIIIIGVGTGNSKGYHLSRTDNIVERILAVAGLLLFAYDGAPGRNFRLPLVDTGKHDKRHDCYKNIVFIQ